ALPRPCRVPGRPRRRRRRAGDDHSPAALRRDGGPRGLRRRPPGPRLRLLCGDGDRDGAVARAAAGQDRPQALRAARRGAGGAVEPGAGPLAEHPGPGPRTDRPGARHGLRRRRGRRLGRGTRRRRAGGRAPRRRRDRARHHRQLRRRRHPDARRHPRLACAAAAADLRPAPRHLPRALRPRRPPAGDAGGAATGLAPPPRLPARHAGDDMRHPARLGRDGDGADRRAIHPGRGREAARRPLRRLRHDADRRHRPARLPPGRAAAGGADRPGHPADRRRPDLPRRGGLRDGAAAARRRGGRHRHLWLRLSRRPRRGGRGCLGRGAGARRRRLFRRRPSRLRRGAAAGRPGCRCRRRRAGHGGELARAAPRRLPAVAGYRSQRM
ncbi:MAG: hypothetical protein AVDCRST_MAG27-4627, partial [uncultured Craurococcus sp.]